MDVGAEFNKVEEMQMTVVITGTVAEFQLLQKNMSNHHYGPMQTLNQAINQQVNKAVEKVQSRTIKA